MILDIKPIYASRISSLYLDPSERLTFEGGVTVLELFKAIFMKCYIVYKGAETAAAKVDSSTADGLLLAYCDTSLRYKADGEDLSSYITEGSAVDNGGWNFSFYLDERRSEKDAVSFDLGEKITGSLDAKAIKITEPALKVENLSKDDSFYMLGNFPFDLTGVRIALSKGNREKLLTYSDTQKKGAYTAQITLEDGTDVTSRIMDGSTLLDGSKPIENANLADYSGKTLKLRITDDSGNSVFEKEADEPKVIAYQCYGIESANIKKIQHADRAYIGKPASEVPLDLAIRIQTNAVTKEDSTAEKTYADIVKKDRPTLRSLGVSLFSSKQSAKSIQSGQNRVTLQGASSFGRMGGFTGSLVTTGETAVAVGSRDINDIAVSGTEITIETDREVEDPAEIHLVVVEGSLDSLGFPCAEAYNVTNVSANQTIPFVDTTKKQLWLVDEKDTIKVKGRNCLYPGLERADIHVYGMLQKGDGNTTAKMVLFDDWKPEYDGQDNIEIKFPCYVASNRSTIDQCKVACLFGANGARNRVFAGGRTSTKAADWHSADTGTDGDFSYFPDDSYFTYGSGDNDIAGYGIVSDGKLMVGMTYSDKSPCVYYRTGTFSYVYDGAGNTIAVNGVALTKESYPCTPTNSHIGGIAPYLYANFNGDMIWVDASSHSIVGLDLTGAVFDSQRIASSRSYCIDSVIKDKALSPEDCFLYADGNRLYYCTPSGTFISDYELNRAKGGYEWFRTDLSNISCIVHSISDGNDMTLLGTTDGQVLAITDDWCDYRSVRLEYSTQIQEKADSAEIEEMTDPATGETSRRISSRTYVLTSEIASEVKSGDYTELWMFPKGGTPKKYGIEKYEDFGSSDSFTLTYDKAHGDYEPPSGEVLSGAETILLIKPEPVKSYYITAPLLYQHSEQLKTVWSYSVFWDTPDISEVAVAQATNDDSYDRTIDAVKHSFNGLDLESFGLWGVTFQRKRLPHIYTQYRPFSAPFFALAFSSDGNSDSVLTKAQVSYSYTGNTYTGDSRG